ncbi:MAG: hypothetical protein FWK04_32910, partial [Nostoc sp. GBBB01]|nr:hypothetical protein [Nostoc sp. GBBB01]
RNLEQLQKYLEVTDEQVLGAAASLAMLSPVSENVGKYIFNYIAYAIASDDSFTTSSAISYIQ